MEGGRIAYEDDKTRDPGTGTRKVVTRHALGARGGDMLETVLSMGLAGERTVRSYPLYDGHGNMVAQVARAEDEAPGSSFMAVPGAAAFELGARRKYDAWGQVRWTEGRPAEQSYCACLQHRRDAESGLVYMRARHYEPWTGRFISEDPAMDGANWYVYCHNDPVNKVDATGKAAHWALVALHALAAGIGIGLGLTLGEYLWTCGFAAELIPEAQGSALEIYNGVMSKIFREGLIGVVGIGVGVAFAGGSIGASFGIGFLTGFFTSFYLGMIAMVLVEMGFEGEGIDPRVYHP
ncbi:MAG: RHS repeat-associated core domain-containing protein [Fimbriimonadaceae bacterium]|nr:RHS repeat-associated core domain-containing protein [Fimbriimonadaceae bacterium]QYK58951.1 MAG: RHS repeat-associated core domain-containing protein [Fimbriimonadaceae bacterium]